MSPPYAPFSCCWAKAADHPISNPLHPSRGTARRLVLAFSHGRLATNLPWSPRRLQLPIPVGVDLLLTPGEHALRRDVADRTVQGVVVMLDVALHHTPHIFQRQWRSRPDAQLSLPGCSASVTSSCVRSIILTGERISISS